MAGRGKALGGTPAVRFLEEQGVAFAQHHYEYDDAPGAIAKIAAEQLGVDAARLLKCLVVALDGGELVCALVGGDRELDLKALAKAAAAKKADMATIPAAERSTGYVKGGISPFGQKKRLRTFLDAAALAHGTVFVNGGRRGLQIELDPHLLVTLVGAEAAPLGR